MYTHPIVLLKRQRHTGREISLFFTVRIHVNTQLDRAGIRMMIVIPTRAWFLSQTIYNISTRTQKYVTRAAWPVYKTHAYINAALDPRGWFFTLRDAVDAHTYSQKISLWRVMRLDTGVFAMMSF